MDNQQAIKYFLEHNVNEVKEKKGKFDYLSWAHAWGEFIKVFPKASFETTKFNGLPYCEVAGGGAIVEVSLYNGEGDHKTMSLYVKNHNNQAVKNPDAKAIMDNTMRCLAKAIALYGLGLYIYQGEDLPDDKEEVEPEPPKPATDDELLEIFRNSLKKAKTVEEIDKFFTSKKVVDGLKARSEEFNTDVERTIEQRKNEITSEVK